MRHYQLTAALVLAFVAGPLAAQSPASVVRQNVEAHLANDFDAFMATFSADACVVVDGMEACGPRAIRRAYSMNFGPNAPMVEVIDWQGSDDGGTMTASYTFANGETICCSVSRYTVRGGKIVRIEGSF